MYRKNRIGQRQREANAESRNEKPLNVKGLARLTKISQTEINVFQTRQDPQRSLRPPRSVTASRNSPRDRSRVRSRGRRTGTPARDPVRRKPFCVAPRAKCRVVAPCDDASRLRFVYLQRRHGDAALSFSLSRVLRRAPLAPSVQSAQNDTSILILSRLARRSAASYDDPLLEFYGPTDGVRSPTARRATSRSKSIALRGEEILANGWSRGAEPISSKISLSRWIFPQIVQPNVALATFNSALRRPTVYRGNIQSPTFSQRRESRETDLPQSA